MPSRHLNLIELTEQTTAPPKGPKPLYWVVALALAAALLYYSLRGIDWAEVWRILSRANLFWILAGLSLATVALFLRSIRWRILLQSQAPVDIPTAFWATSAGYFGNNFLPARAGEVIRSMMVSARAGLGKLFVLTTALSERIVDAITLVIISSVVLLTLPTRPGLFDSVAKPFAFIGFGGAFAVAILPMLEGVLRYLLNRLPLPHSLREKLCHIMEQILVGIRSFHRPARLVKFVGLTLVIWCIDGVTTICGMHALGMTISLPIAFLLMTGLGLGSALPSTPGYVGIYQFVTVSVLVPFGFSRTDAIAYSLLAQATQYALMTFWGLLGMARSRGTSFRTPAAKAA